MKRKIGIVAAVAISLPLAIGWLTAGHRSQGNKGADYVAVKAVDRVVAPAATPLQALPFYAYGLTAAVAEPLLLLPRMKEAVAAAIPEFAETPAGKLLASQLTTAGLGSIRIGMTVEEVAAEGITLEPLDNTAQGECQYLGLSEYSKSMSFMVVGNQIIRIDIWTGSPVATKSGIQIGSSEAQVLEAYEGRIESVPNPNTGGQYLIFTPAGEGQDLYRLVFETNGEGEVVTFRSGQFPAVIWPEGCL